MPEDLGVAEREGFEPPIDLRLCLISSQVHSTGLCHLSVYLSYRKLSLMKKLSYISGEAVMSGVHPSQPIRQMTPDTGCLFGPIH